MVTLPEEPTPEPTRADLMADKAYAAKDAVTSGIRYTVSGDKNGRTRRGVLFIVIIVSLILSLPVPGLIAAGLLMFTDQVVTSE